MSFKEQTYFGNRFPQFLFYLDTYYLLLRIMVKYYSYMKSICISGSEFFGLSIATNVFSFSVEFNPRNVSIRC